MIANTLSANRSMRFIVKLYKGQLTNLSLPFSDGPIHEYCASIKLYNEYIKEYELSFIDIKDNPDRYEQCADFDEDNDFNFSSTTEKIFLIKPENMTIDQAVAEKLFMIADDIEYKAYLTCNSKKTVGRYSYVFQHTDRFPKKSLEHHPEYKISAKLNSIAANLCANYITENSLPKYAIKLSIRWIPVNAEGYKINLAKNRDSFYKGILRHDVSEYDNYQKILVMSDFAEKEWFGDYFLEDLYFIGTMGKSSIPARASNSAFKIIKNGSRGKPVKDLVKFRRNGETISSTEDHYANGVIDDVVVNLTQQAARIAIVPPPNVQNIIVPFSSREETIINIMQRLQINFQSFTGQIDGLLNIAPTIEGEFLFVDDEFFTGSSTVKRAIIAIQNMINRDFLGANVKFTLVDNLNDAVTAIETRDIRALFMDTDLAGAEMNGPEFVRQLRLQGNQLPIISTTSNTLDTLDIKSYITESGYNGYIPKTDLSFKGKEIAEKLPYWISYILRNNPFEVVY